MYSSKIESIQLLRFISAFLIITIHLGYHFGHIGVDIFFVISGFIITYVSQGNSHKFFIKRLIRIIPVYWLVTFFFFITLFLFPNLFDLSEPNLVYFIKSIFFIPFNNINTGHYPIVIYGWTLNYEIYFYFIFSISLLFSKKFFPIIFTFLFVILYLCNLNLSNFLSKTYSNIIIFEFYFGFILYYFFRYFYNFLNIKFLYKLIIVFFLISISMLLILSKIENRLIVYGIPSTLIVFVFLLFYKVKLPRIINLLGDSSYILYLIHPYVFQIFIKINDFFNLEVIIFNILILCAIILSIFLSIIMHKVYEKPIQKKLNNLLLKNN